MIKMPDGWKDRAEYLNSQVWFSDQDAQAIEDQAKTAMIAEACASRKFYDDCGEVNTTFLAEWCAQESDLYIGDNADIPEQLFEWAFEVSARIEKKWAQDDQPDQEEEDEG